METVEIAERFPSRLGDDILAAATLDRSGGVRFHGLFSRLGLLCTSTGA